MVAYFEYSGCVVASRIVLSFALLAATHPHHEAVQGLPIYSFAHMCLSLQTPTLSLRCEAMQGALAQLLQQLSTTDSQSLQWLLLPECCIHLQQLSLKSGTTNCDASSRDSCAPRNFWQPG